MIGTEDQRFYVYRKDIEPFISYFNVLILYGEFGLFLWTYLVIKTVIFFIFSKNDDQKWYFLRVDGL